MHMAKHISRDWNYGICYYACMYIYMCVCAKLNIEAACVSVCVRVCLWYMYIHVSTVYTSFSAKWSPGGRTPTASRRRFSCRRSAIGTAQTRPWGCRRNTIINMALCVYVFLRQWWQQHTQFHVEYVCIKTDDYVYRCTDVHVYIHMYICTYSVCVYIYCIRVCVYVCTSVRTNIYVTCWSIIHAFMHACMHARVCMYVCVYVCM